MSELKEGFLDKYIDIDGKKFVGQIIKKPECRYKTVTNFQRKPREEYISIHKSKFKKYKIPKLDKSVPTDTFIGVGKYNAYGKNIESDYEKINIDKLVLNSVNAKKYMILKIISGIYIDKDKGCNFICEDSNKHVVIVVINGSELYFDVTSYNMLEKNVFTKEKYIAIVEPNYGIFESDYDEIKIDSPNEIIIFKDKGELDYFLDKTKNESPENYKLLGNLMLSNKFYEKAIFYYNKGIKINGGQDNMDIILHSNLAEAYLKFGYYSRCIQNSDYCLKKINDLMKKGNKDDFLTQQKIKNLFRKIKGLVELRKFKEAYEILYNKSENNPYNDIINEFLKMDQLKNYTDIIINGYQNNLGHFDFKKMLQEEKVNFHFKTYGDYLNPKIEIQSEKGRGIKMIAKEKINQGELLIVEKAIVYTTREFDDHDYETKVSKDNPKIMAEMEMFNILNTKLRKAPFDTEKFYYLFDGKNLTQDLNERKQYLYDQDSGKIDLDYFKVNQVICLNKYGNGRNIFYTKETCCGVWGYASFFNHDCLPNSAHFGIGSYYIGYCIKDIDKGEEITSKYADPKDPYQERQKELLENWRFKCKCQLCQYQEKKLDPEYERFIELLDKPAKEISIKTVKLFEEYLDKNKKRFTCFDMAKGYLKLEEYYYSFKDINNTKRCSDIITKYANGKNYFFQKSNLYIWFLCVSATHSNEFVLVFTELINFLEKYLPLSSEDIQYFIRNQLNMSF